MPNTNDPAESILSAAPVGDDVKGHSWEAYHAATDTDDLVKRLTPLNLPDQVKGKLWEAKYAEEKANAQTQHAPDKQGFLDSLWDQTGGAIGKTASALGNAAKEALNGNFVPLGAIPAGIAGASLDQLKQAQSDFRDVSQLPGGRAASLGSGIIHTLGATPVIGPAAIASGSKAGQQFMDGNLPGAAGTLVGAIGQVLLPKAIEAIPAAATVKIPGVGNGLNPVEQAATDFGDARNINTAMATNNPLIKGGQFLSGNAGAGAIPAVLAKRAVARQLARVGNELTDTDYANQGAAPLPKMIPETAGQATQDALSSKVAAHQADANGAYDEFRRIEALPQNSKTVQVGTKQGTASGMLDAQGNPIPGATVPVMQTIPLPIDYAPIKAQIGPIVDELTQRTSGLQQEASPALPQLKSMLQQPGHVQASAAELDLGALKQIIRDTKSTPRAKALAQTAADALNEQIMSAAKSAGPDAVDALKFGRESTYDQYRTQGVLDNVAKDALNEPVKTFRLLTQPGDVNVNLLRSVVKETPEAAPGIGRGYLQELLNTTNAEGGFSKAATVLNKWNALGDSTKKLLFHPMQIQHLDNFFLLAKKISESSNPSGTAAMVTLSASGSAILHNPLTGVAANLGAAALSKLLYSPRGVNLLTKGLTLTAGRTPQAVALYEKLANLVTAAGSDASQTAQSSSTTARQ